MSRFDPAEVSMDRKLTDGELALVRRSLREYATDGGTTFIPSRPLPRSSAPIIVKPAPEPARQNSDPAPPQPPADPGAGDASRAAEKITLVELAEIIAQVQAARPRHPVIERLRAYLGALCAFAVFLFAFLVLSIGEMVMIEHTIGWKDPLLNFSWVGGIAGIVLAMINLCGAIWSARWSFETVAGQKLTG